MYVEVSGLELRPGFWPLFLLRTLFCVLLVSPACLSLLSLSSLFSSLPPSVSLSAFPLRPLLLPSQEIVFRNQSQIINHVQERKCRLLPFTFIPAKSLFLSSLAARDAFSQNSKTGFQWHPLPLFSSPSLLSSLCCRCSSDCIDTGD